MLFVTTYKIVGERTPEAAQALMKRFGELGDVPGQIAHYVFADGSGGVVIADVADIKDSHSRAIAYNQWLDFDTKAVLTIEDALPALIAELGRS